MLVHRRMRANRGKRRRGLRTEAHESRQRCATDYLRIHRVRRHKHCRPQEATQCIRRRLPVWPGFLPSVLLDAKYVVSLESGDGQASGPAHRLQLIHRVCLQLFEERKRTVAETDDRLRMLHHCRGIAHYRNFLDGLGSSCQRFLDRLLTCDASAILKPATSAPRRVPILHARLGLAATCFVCLSGCC
jgi:hypothetical protein